MDFYSITEQQTKDGIRISPNFQVGRAKDLMIRGHAFYAIYDEERQLWSTDEYDVQRLIDRELEEYKNRSPMSHIMHVSKMSSYNTKHWNNFQSYIKLLPDNAHQLDNKLTFANTVIRKTDYVSKRLPYNLEEGNIDSYEELIGTLFVPEEREKLEWAVGSIIAGDSRSLQKFIVLYGEAGSGKSTFLNILEKLFQGYYTAFDAKALTSANNSFSTESFRTNPLVAIQHDGDLSKIEDNSKLNSIVSHENMAMNEKYKPVYMSKANCFLFMGTNKPVKITDAKSGVIRRLIDVSPSNKKVSSSRYHILMAQIEFELGAIAYHCLEVYKRLGKNYYSNYKPVGMMFETDILFNFIDEYSVQLAQDPGITLTQAYTMYKTYCDDSLVEYKMQRHKFREELKSYFNGYKDRYRIEDKYFRCFYFDFKEDFLCQNSESEETKHILKIEHTESLLDKYLMEQPAQYANASEIPAQKWEDVNTTLKDINTSDIHYVKLQPNHIVIDFDLKDSNGEKSLERNLKEAVKWPLTYSELSKSGQGVHLHYIYDGDVSKLSRIYAEDIEVKVFTGNSSLRRKVTKCNNASIAKINSGLPLKGDLTMTNIENIKSEMKLRDLIIRNLHKEFHSNTKQSINFIYKILEDAYISDLKYDVTDLRPRILVFANNATNQSDYCVKLVTKMKFASESISESVEKYKDDDLVFFDVEVFPNLFIVVWKTEKGTPVKMINPTGQDIEPLFSRKLVGFNCRRYDNHILYARYIGYDLMQLFNLSQRIINNSKNAMFGEAYNISYTDVYDFSNVKQSLKKFEIELGIHHNELGYKWDEEVPEDKWEVVAEYCADDVIATEAVFNNRKDDFVARQILADLSGLTVNDTTNTHTTKIIFGHDKTPQKHFNYIDLSEMFPGYIFENGKSIYKGEETGEGGYVYSEPGMYTNVAVLDVASMHPTSLICMNMFGPYTEGFRDIVDARVAIKHKDYDKAKLMLNGILEKYLVDTENSSALAYALKIAINSVYGLTSAKFDNPFRDPRNRDNIVAKRGALFMIDLKHAVQEKGYIVAHIKTDSIKIPNADEYIINYVMDFGKKYGYNFEHEATYSKFCLVNNAVYIAHDGKEWTATGTQFAIPYVFKTLFSKEEIIFDDLCETKSVMSALYLDFNEKLGEDEHNYVFVGKIGRFCPIKDGYGGGLLLREKDGKYHAATGTKGFRWIEADKVKELGLEDAINRDYYVNLVEEAKQDISKYGDIYKFIEQ